MRVFVIDNISRIRGNMQEFTAMAQICEFDMLKTSLKDCYSKSWINI